MMNGDLAELGRERPLILVTNDDGVYAPGIEALVQAVQALGDVAVVAPDRNRSGVSQLITLHHPLRAEPFRPRWRAVDGSPADCVYLGIHELLPRRPDIVFSGVNAGPNMSFDIHYSGTVGGAREGTLLGVPSIAVSLTSPRRGSYERAAEFASEVGAQVLQEGLPEHVLLNINVPAGPAARWQRTFLGHRLFRHSVHRRDDPRGGVYYWIGGVPGEPHDIPGSDCNAVAEGVISVTPLQTDSTAKATSLDWTLGSTEKMEGLPPPADLADVPLA